MVYDNDFKSKKTLTLILYIMYIVGIFSIILLPVIALIINYVKRAEMQGTIFASHFSWQIRTVWWYILWNIVAFLPFGLLFFTADNEQLLAGTALTTTVFCFGVILISWVWVLYRAIKGLLVLNDDRPLD